MKITLNKILSFILIFIFSFIIISTIIGFITKKAIPGKNLREIDLKPNNVSLIESNKELESFTSLGRLRVFTAKDKDGIKTPIIITPWFPYEKEDTEFYEELSKKSSVIKSIITQYFSLYTEKDLLSFKEEKIKKEIVEEINNHLVLGKIENIYFSEYNFLK